VNGLKRGSEGGLATADCSPGLKFTTLAGQVAARPPLWTRASRADKTRSTGARCFQAARDWRGARSRLDVNLPRSFRPVPALLRATPRAGNELHRDKVESDARLVSNHPCIVAGSGYERFSRANFDFCAVLRPNTHPTRDHVSDVFGRLILRERLDVLRPSPAGSVDAPPNRDLAQVDGPAFTLVEKRPRVVREVETLRGDFRGAHDLDANTDREPRSAPVGLCTERRRASDDRRQQRISHQASS
jgi:hypothetical protein